MKKIKLAYDWWGPKGPMINNYPPNILQLADATHGIEIRDWRKFFYPLVNTTIFKHIDGYEFVPSATLQPDDVFVYEYLYVWRQPLPMTCQPGDGMIEQSYISATVLNYIRSKNGYILFENTAEAFINHHDLWSIHNYFKFHKIPYKKVIYQTGCPNAAEYYSFWADHNNIPADDRMNVIFFDWVEWNLSKDLQSLNFPHLPHSFSQIEYDFISFNRRFRFHRSALLQVFYKHNLLEKSLFSMPEVDPDMKQGEWITFVDRSFSAMLGFEYHDLEKIQKMLPLKIDGIDDIHRMVHDQNNMSSKYYMKSLISIVTETNFDTEIISTTEKTFKPIKYKKPFIMVGAPKTLEFLQKWGYKTFGEFWDESYDQEANHRLRMIKIGLICKEISEWSKEKKEEFYHKSQEIVNHNYNILYNRYPSNMNSRFWHNLRDSHA